MADRLAERISEEDQSDGDWGQHDIEWSKTGSIYHRVSLLHSLSVNSSAVRSPAEDEFFYIISECWA